MPRRPIAFLLAGLILLVSVVGTIGWLRARERGRREAAVAEARAREAAEVRANLRSTDPIDRLRAAKQLVVLVPPSEEAIPELSVALKEAVEGIAPRDKTLEDLNMIGMRATPFARALWAIGGPAEARLMDLLDEKDPALRMATVLAFGDHNPSFDQRAPSLNAIAVRVLRKALRDGEPWIRFQASGFLGDRSDLPEARQAFPDLLELQANDPDPKVREIAKIAADRMKP